MENKIVEDFQNLQVFAAYDFFKMDELVQDLTQALEDTANCKQRRRDDCSKKSKRRSKKRKTYTDSAAWELGNMSEASESSIDEAIKDYMKNIAQQSDSDELLSAAKRLPSLAELTSNSTVFSFAESDSVNENFSPMRPHRRKRRFKRMAVDPETHMFMNPHLSNSTQCGSHSVLQENESDHTLTPTTSGAEASSSILSQQEIQLGKRKRSMKDIKNSNSFDLDSMPEEGGGIYEGGSSQDMDSKWISESGTSSLSSNESDGLHTNDEARDGDDEQSDFFYEPGPACGIPGIIPWWDAGNNTHKQTHTTDSNFEKILQGSFEHMSSAAKRSFRARLKMMTKPGRQFRTGRRRLHHDMKSLYSLSCFLHDGQKWNDQFRRLAASRHNTNSCSNNLDYDPKRRKRVLPHSTSEEVGLVGGKADPIPNTNLGSRILQNMGWNPGMGLGADGSGMIAPVQVFKRPWRQGLGTHEPPTSTANS